MADPIKTSEVSSGYINSIYDGAVLGDFSEDQSKTKVVSQIGIGLIPGVGQFADARDTISAVKDIGEGKSGGWANLLFSTIGWVPLAGDFAKSARKIGVKETLSGVGDAFRSVRESWKNLSLWHDVKTGESGKLWYKPGTDLEAESLGGALGTTNRYGDVKVIDDLSDAEKKAVYDHESVHRFFSPKLIPLQELRAKIGILGYQESHLLRRVEEGLAESWATFKKQGFTGLKEAWRFPYTSAHYGLNSERIKVETHALLGVASSTVSGAAALGDAINDTTEKK